MDTKLIAVALSVTALPLSAFADETNVVIYGTLNADIEGVRAKNATAGPLLEIGTQTRVASNSSNIGFKGTETLAGGIKAIFQIESSVNVDAGSGTLTGRNSNVGVTGPFGTVFFGNWDTPYKASTQPLDPFGNTSIAAYSGIMGSPGLNVASTTGSATTSTSPAGTSLTSAAFGFDRRENNSIQYWTPSYSGFTGRLSYSPGEINIGGIKPNLWSVAGTYDNGPLLVTAAYEQHRDYLAAAFASTGPGLIALLFPTAGVTTVTDSKDYGGKIGASYTFGPAKIAAAFERLKYRASTNLGNLEAKRNAWMIAGSYQMGATVLRASYMDTSKDEFNGVRLGARDGKQWAVGVGYTFSRRTEAFALYTGINNSNGASYNFGINPLTQLGVGVPAGADPRGFALGIKHTF